MTESTHTIVVLDDGETYSGADGATLQVITDAQHEDLCEGAEPDDLEPVAAYDIGALPELLSIVERFLEATSSLPMAAAYNPGTGDAAVWAKVDPVYEDAQELLALLGTPMGRAYEDAKELQERIGGDS